MSIPKIKVDWDIDSHMAVHDRISGIIDDSRELKGMWHACLLNLKRSPLIHHCHVQILSADRTAVMRLMFSIKPYF